MLKDLDIQEWREAVFTREDILSGGALILRAMLMCLRTLGCKGQKLNPLPG